MVSLVYPELIEGNYSPVSGDYNNARISEVSNTISLKTIAIVASTVPILHNPNI